VISSAFVICVNPSELKQYVLRNGSGSGVLLFPRQHVRRNVAIGGNGGLSGLLQQLSELLIVSPDKYIGSSLDPTEKPAFSFHRTHSLLASRLALASLHSRLLLGNTCLHNCGLQADGLLRVGSRLLPPTLLLLACLRL